MKKVEEIYQTYYFAYYKANRTRPIAVSEIKELVKEYMQTHRYVEPENYEIEELSFTIGEILLDYQNEYITHYENWYLPAIDIEMIQLRDTDLDRKINETMQGLKEIILLMDGIKKISSSDKDILVKAMHIILQARQKKKIWNKMIDNYKLSDLIFMDIDDYIRNKEMYINMKDARARWDFMIPKKGDDEIIDIEA